MAGGVRHSANWVFLLPVAVVLPAALLTWIFLVDGAGYLFTIQGASNRWADWELKSGKLVGFLAGWGLILFALSWIGLGTARLTAIVFRMLLLSPLVGLIILIANGEVGMSWLAETVDPTWQITSQQSFREPLAVFVVLCLLALFRYRRLLQSRRPAASFWERQALRVIVSGIVVGVPLLLVGWAAREDISGYAKFRDPDLLPRDIWDWQAFIDLLDDKQPEQAAGPQVAKGAQAATAGVSESRGLFDLGADGNLAIGSVRSAESATWRSEMARILSLAEDKGPEDEGAEGKEAECDGGEGKEAECEGAEGKEAEGEGAEGEGTDGKKPDSEEVQRWRNDKCALLDAVEKAAKTARTDGSELRARDAVVFTLRLQRLVDRALKGGVDWDRNKHGLVDGRHGWLARAGLLLHGVAGRPSNRAIASVLANRLARDVQDAVMLGDGRVHFCRRLRERELTFSLVNEVATRIGGTKFSEVDRFVMQEISPNSSDPEQFIVLWRRATDHHRRARVGEADRAQGHSKLSNGAGRIADGGGKPANGAGKPTNGGGKPADQANELVQIDVVEVDPYWTPDRIAHFNRLLLESLHPKVFKRRTMVSTPIVIAEDQKVRLGWLAFFGCTFGVLFLLLPLNQLAAIHRYYRRKIQQEFLRPVSHREAKPQPLFLEDLNGHRYGAPYQVFLASLHLGCEAPAEQAEPPRMQRHHSLAFSPRHIGTPACGYVRTESLRCKYTLADAITISGAAVSPMALADGPLRWVLSAFNLRTGAWVYNPRQFHKEPSWPLRVFHSVGRFSYQFFYQQKYVMPWQVYREWFRESAGEDSREPAHNWVVGSAADGGYHDYLGLNELLRRRCRLIIVSDASTNQDDDEFEVLAGAIRQAKHEGIEILDLDDNRPLDIDQLDRHEKERTSKQHYLVGRIHYPPTKERTKEQAAAPSVGNPSWNPPDDGILVYLQMGMTGDENVDLRQYHASHPNFPDETIANQFFDEMLVDAYRSLGWHIGQQVCRAIPYAEALKSIRHSTADKASGADAPRDIGKDIDEVTSWLIEGYVLNNRPADESKPGEDDAKRSDRPRPTLFPSRATVAVDRHTVGCASPSQTRNAGGTAARIGAVIPLGEQNPAEPGEADQAPKRPDAAALDVADQEMWLGRYEREPDTRSTVHHCIDAELKGSPDDMLLEQMGVARGRIPLSAIAVACHETATQHEQKEERVFLPGGRRRLNGLAAEASYVLMTEANDADRRREQLEAITRLAQGVCYDVFRQPAVRTAVRLAIYAFLKAHDHWENKHPYDWERLQQVVVQLSAALTGEGERSVRAALEDYVAESPIAATNGDGLERPLTEAADASGAGDGAPDKADA